MFEWEEMLEDDTTKAESDRKLSPSISDHRNEREDAPSGPACRAFLRLKRLNVLLSLPLQILSFFGHACGLLLRNLLLLQLDGFSRRYPG